MRGAKPKKSSARPKQEPEKSKKPESSPTGHYARQEREKEAARLAKETTSRVRKAAVRDVTMSDGAYQSAPVVTPRKIHVRTTREEALKAADINAGARAVIGKVRPYSMPAPVHVPARSVLAMMKSRIPRE